MKIDVAHRSVDHHPLLRHIFFNLQVDPAEHPVLLTEPALNPAANRERLIHSMLPWQEAEQRPMQTVWKIMIAMSGHYGCSFVSWLFVDMC